VNADGFTALKPAFEQRLRQLGVVDNDMGLAVDRVITALENTLSDAKGRWILFGQHTDAHSEFSMTVPKDEGFERLILDRTFVCEEGERWIVDFKTSTHEGGKLDQFLLSETLRYQPQLKSYRDAMAHSENRPIRTALYFPLLKKFHEVDVDRQYGQK
jgi:ATP-dependent exoDNAse (exonuclease V) beta subunit